MAVIRTSEISTRNLNSLSSGTVLIVDSEEILHMDVQLASDITLIFEGGKLESTLGVEVQGNNTTLIASRVQIFGSKVTVSGTWNIEEAYPEWFGAVAYQTVYDSQSRPHYSPAVSSVAINKAIQMKHTGKVSFASGIYLINAPINVPCGVHLIGTPGKGLTRRNIEDPVEGTIFRIKSTFVSTPQAPYVIGLNVEMNEKTVNEEILVDNEELPGVTNKVVIEHCYWEPIWQWHHSMPVTVVENIQLRYFDRIETRDGLPSRAGTSDPGRIPIGIVTAGGFQVSNVSFFDVPNAIKSSNDYADGKCVTNCLYMNEFEIPSATTVLSEEELHEEPDQIIVHSIIPDIPMAFDLSGAGDALVFSNNLVYGDNSRNRSLILNGCRGGVVSGNVFHSDVVVRSCFAVQFIGNNFGPETQLRVESSQMLLTSNCYTKGSRPSIMILGDRFGNVSQASLEGEIINLRGLLSLYGGDQRPTTAQIDLYRSFKSHDIEIGQFCILNIKNSFRNFMTDENVGTNPTGLLVADTNQNHNVEAPPYTINEIQDFNEDSYRLSFYANIVRKRVISKNIFVPNCNDTQVVWMGWVEYSNLSWWIGNAGSYCYAYQVIWDRARKITGVKNNSPIFNITRNNIPLTFNLNQDSPRAMQVEVLSEAPIPLRLFRKAAGSTSQFDYDEYVDIPVCGAVVLVDNGYDVSGYRWKPVDGNSIVVPGNPTIRTLHKLADNVECTAQSISGHSYNGWITGDKISQLNSNTTRIF